MSFESKKLRRAAVTIGVAASLLSSALASEAKAAGIEETVGGAIGLGRAAYFARVNDFMAILQNPANLSVLSRGDLGAELRLPLLTSCYDRAYNETIGAMNGYKRDRAGNLAEHFDEVCNDAFPAPTANIGWARSYENGLGWGIGLFTPAGVGGAKYGTDTNVSVAPRPMEPYTVTETGVESPTRQMGIEREGVIASLMLGLGYQPHKMIRFGASFGAGFASVRNKNMVSSTGGTFRDQEIINEIFVRDSFIPRATAGLVFAPLNSKSALEFFGTLMYQDDIKGEGYSDLSANGITGAPLKNCRSESPGSHCRVNGAKLTVPMATLEAVFGLRYALRRVPRERALDPMKDEIFDIEVDASWAQTSNVDMFQANIHNQMPGTPGAPTVQFGNDMGANRLPVQQVSVIPKYWKDTWTVRAGTDINFVPEVFTLRLGGSYATSATSDAYMNTDYMPVEKIGAHVGATFALATYRITLGYAHIFFETREVAIGEGRVLDIATNNAQAAQAVNEGRFRGGLDVFSLGLNARF
jgi:long-subunit fatty acid transport protein